MKKLNDKHHYKIDLKSQKDFFVNQFKTSSYYFMWPFSNIDNYFNEAIVKIENNEKPYEDNEVFDVIDQIISTS
jgi:hypothetical protein